MTGPVQTNTSGNPASSASDLHFGSRIRQRVFYRLHQFRDALLAKPDPNQLKSARKILSPTEYTLFSKMQPDEQAHSLQVLERLRQLGQTHPNLLAAALLHDAGKSRQPLKLWERVMIVLGRLFFPSQVRKWGHGKNAGFKKAFVTAEQHAQWGAEMAVQAGSDPLTISLIRRHQDRIPVRSESLEDQLLVLLQAADGET